MTGQQSDWQAELAAMRQREKTALYSKIGKAQVEKFIAAGFDEAGLVKAFGLKESESRAGRTPVEFQAVKTFLKMKAVLDFYEQPNSAQLAATMTAPIYTEVPDFPDQMSVTIDDGVSVSLRNGDSEYSPIYTTQVEKPDKGY